MAALSITATAVVPGGDAVLEQVTLGANATAGQASYNDGTEKLADSDNATLAARIPSGILVSGGNSGQKALKVKSGKITMNAVLTAGTFYYASPTAGGIGPFADLVSGNRVVQIGYAESTTVLVVGIKDTGVVIA